MWLSNLTKNALEQKEKDLLCVFCPLTQTQILLGADAGFCVFSRWNQVKDNKHPLSPVLLPVGDDGEAVRVVSVAADVRVPPGHTCWRGVIL